MTNSIIQIEPWIDDQELLQLMRVIKSTYVVEHDLTKEFEEMICELTGSKYAVAMTNGTAALFCCLKALGIGQGDEVIVPNMTFIASSNAVLMAGAIPVLCEVDKDTFCIDVKEAERCITDKTKAIMPVHLYGQSADMDSIMKFAKKHDIKVVEDAAQGVGVLYKNQHVGTFGDLGILSFYGNKTITCGEGGVVLTDDEGLRDECYRLKNHGRDGKGVFKHDHIGYNFCFTEMQAAVGISQLKKLPTIIKRKKEIHDRYYKELNNIECRQVGFFAINDSEHCTPVHWFSSFLYTYSPALIAYLSEGKIQTRQFFYPLDKQPCYTSDVPVVKNGNYDISKDIFDRGISLPSSYRLTDEDQSKVIERIKSWLFWKNYDVQ
jgi:perosamine synthetase